MNMPKVLYRLPDCAGKKFQPSNGTEGMTFTSAFCDRCIHEKWTHTRNDNDAKCEILSATMIYDVKDKEYPAEWIFNEEGYPVCTAWKHWDWGKDDDGNFIDPPPPPVYDPNQLVMPFILDEIVKEKQEEVTA